MTGHAASAIDEYAARLAATLPPLTASEAATVGRLAGELDARRSAARPVPTRLRRAA